ncbi:NUDIX hydrolase [Ktedonobacteria bacterium brp13]|nr:NUDIX hydrolase [Ktedonobacteria bacterium brp13]
MRAYSAGGVVFRLAPASSSDIDFSVNHGLLSSTDVFGSEGSKQSTESTELEDQATMVAMEVALVGRSHAGIWSLPKGTPQTGETIEQVAVREAQEETGLQVRLIGFIGSISYSFVREQIRYHKQVRHFLLEAIGGDTALHDHEYDMVQWFSLHEACRHLTYQNEVHILYQAEEILHQWLQYQQQEGQK